MEAAVNRLERVAERLERLEASRGASNITQTARPAPSATSNVSAARLPDLQEAPSGPALPAGDAIAAYDQYFSNYVATFVKASKSLSPDVVKAAGHLEAAFKGVRDVLAISERSQPPDQPGLQQLIAPVAAELSAATAATEGRRGPAFNHQKVVAECLQSLSWIVYSGSSCGMSPPPQFIAEAWQSSEFYANRIVMEFKGKDDVQVAWVRALKEVMIKLEEFVRRNYAAGLRWNSAGVPLAQALTQALPPPGGAAATPAAAAPPAVQPAPPRGQAPPPPPPPGRPPPPPLYNSTSSAASGESGSKAPPSMNALFKELQKGEGITAGLKKVTDDMKTKNRADRPGVVSTSAATALRPAAGAKGVGGAAAGGPPRFELMDKKWVVEYQQGAKDLVINATNPAHKVYMFGCRDCVLQVKGKVNAVTLDSCRKTGLVFDELIAACEVINCNGVQVQCTGKVATLSVEKTDGVQIYVSREAAQHPDFQVVTAKCSEVNIVVVPLAAEDADSAEHPVPEQFISTFQNGHLVTNAVAHSGA